MEEKRDKKDNIENRTIIIIDWETRKVLVQNKGQGKLDFEHEPIDNTCKPLVDRGCKQEVDRGVSTDLSTNSNALNMNTLELTLDTLESLFSNENWKTKKPAKIRWTFTEPESDLISFIFAGEFYRKQFMKEREEKYYETMNIITGKQNQGITWNIKSQTWEQTKSFKETVETR